MQYAPRRCISWGNASNHPVPWPNGVDEAHLRHVPGLVHEFVPDARGVMVLTDAHLAKASDLSGWNIEALGHGRHLVQARDLAAWYAHPEPDPAVLARARSEFGRMIHTHTDRPRAS